MKILKDKVVLVTGGASGIGEIMCRLLLERGANIIIWDINIDNLEKVRLKYSSLGRLTIMNVDVSSISQIKQSAKEVINDFGGIDLLINNAGIIVGNYFHEHSEADITNTLNINANAPIYITHAFIGNMLLKNSGHICNIASSGGLLSNPKMSVYVASKWSLIGFSDSLRLEMEQLKKNINVTTIMPYYINTGMFDGVKSKIPILDPEATAITIIKAIVNNKKMVSIPGYIYRITRFSQAILPFSIFDWFTGNVLGVYKTMEQFKGRKG